MSYLPVTERGGGKVPANTHFVYVAGVTPQYREASAFETSRGGLLSFAAIGKFICPPKLERRPTGTARLSLT